MTNKHRGEVALQAGDQTYTLCLTLQALADIEAALGAEDIADIGARLLKPKSADLIAILAALMRGGGHDVADADAGRLSLSLEDIIGAIVQVFETSGLLRWQAVTDGEPANAPPAPSNSAGEDAAKNQPAPQA